MMTKKVIVGLLFFFIVYTLTGFFILPPVLKSVLAKKLIENLHRTVTIEDVDINPYILSARIRGLVIKDQQGKEPFSSLEELYINLQASSALKQALIVKEVRLIRPYIKIIRREPQLYNFSDLIKEKDGTGGEPLGFSLGNIQIAGGRIDVVDSPKNKQHSVTDIAITLPFLSNIGEQTDIFVQPSFQAVINGTNTVLEGQTKPFHDTLETTFQIDLKGINIPLYAEYLPAGIRIKIPSGFLDVQASISYLQFKDKAPSFQSKGTVVLSNLIITDLQDLPLVSLPNLNIDIAPSRFLSGDVHLSNISLTSPEIYIRRDKEGVVNLNQVVQTSQSAGETGEKPEKQPFSLMVDQFDLKGGIVTFADASAADNVDLVADNLDIKVQGLSTQTGRTGSAEIVCRLNQKGTILSKATFGINPLIFDSSVSIEGLEPGWVQSYFTDRIQVILSSGKLSTKGQLSLSKDNNSNLQATFKGKAAITEFASVDKHYTDDFLTFKTLSLNDMDIGFNPTYVRIDEIIWEDFFSSIIVNPDGQLNLSTVFKKGQEEDPTKKDEGKENIRDIQVNKISLKNGRINFTDRQIDPHYFTDLVNIEGTVSGLSSQKTKTAVVDLSARLNDNAQFMITGRINPLKEALFVDLHSSLTDTDLTLVTPYSDKYIGYPIAKGKLTLELNYLIENNKLDSQNDVYIDQLTFGDPVESPDSLDLPVKFAASLLKDPQGRIDLYLPASGRTDDPEFKVGKIIFQMLVNLVTKAATSPFSLLESMYPGAESLNYIEFEYGRADLPDASHDKFDVLLQILLDKPTLALEITGYVDVENDRQGLVTYLFEKKLKAQKLMDLLKKGRPAVAVDEVTIEPDEYGHYLKKAYKAETFSKPKNALGFPQSLPVEEMKKLIIRHIEVKNSDLRMLATQREQQVKNSLVKSQMINPERIFLIETQSLSPEKRESLRDSRVEINLK
jgi:hypothetical protein